MRTVSISLFSLVGALACGANGPANDATNVGGGGGGGSSTAGSGSATGGSSRGGTGSGAGSGSGATGGQIHVGPMFAGADCPSDLGLSDAFALPGVKAQVDGANVRITFEPQNDAADYRVYLLPKKDQVSATGIKDAVYRCAGSTSLPSPPQEDEAREPPPGARTRVDSNVEGYTRKREEAQLGYVFTTPGEDRIPVYAMGDPNLLADNTDCYEMRWPESRKKRYVADEAERAKLVASSWRDDGVAFYVPKPGSAGTRPVYQHTVSSNGWGAYFYMTDDAERAARKEKGSTEAEAFSVATENVEGAEPLMRVYYGLTCAHGHDELVAGMARFRRALAQGDSTVTELHYAGLAEEATLVVEALDQKCPYQGALAPMSRPARVDPFPGGNDVPYTEWMTLEQMAKTSPDGEAYINGQGNDTKPRAISRACVKVEPEEVPKMDFFFDARNPEVFEDAVYRNFQHYDTQSELFDINFNNIATDQWTIGVFQGELWTTYADWAADTGGKIRITPKQRGTFSADSFLHASMVVDMVSSARRYPQMLIGTGKPPIQENLKDAVTIVIQPIGGINSPIEGQLQFCDHQEWDVNNQCPMFEIQKLKGPDGGFLAPRPEITGLVGVDRTVRFDAYVSTKRVYWYMNKLPYACADLPEGKLPEGSATITFGDVLYHSGVDLEKWYPFHLDKMHLHTTRHFSNLGFSSGVQAPPWDETSFPCAPASSLRK
jgi:Repeat of unknown function (DUF5648)